MERERAVWADSIAGPSKEWKPETITKLPEFGGWLPPVWFAGLNQALTGAHDRFYSAMPSMAQFTLVVVVAMAIITYYISYRRHRRLLLEAPVRVARSRIWEWGLIRLLAGSPQREGILCFLAKTQARSRTRRLLWFPWPQL